MSIDFVLRGMMVSLDTPTAVELSHWMGDLGCGHPISVRDWHSGTISLAQMKRPASSASAAEDMMFLMICATVRTGPLYVGAGTFSESIMCAPARLRALVTLRYAASECAARTTPLAL